MAAKAGCRIRSGWREPYHPLVGLVEQVRMAGTVSSDGPDGGNSIIGWSGPVSQPHPNSETVYQRMVQMKRTISKPRPDGGKSVMQFPG